MSCCSYLVDGHRVSMLTAEARLAVGDRPGYVQPVPNEPPLPRSFFRVDLEAAGFIGWRTWEELRRSGLTDVPTAPAAYVVFRPSALEAGFLTSNQVADLRPRIPRRPRQH